MTFTVGDIDSYHAHVYFDEKNRKPAKALREAVVEAFPQVAMGRWHEKNVGPHPRWSYQIAFDANLFGDLAPWLMMHRRGCTIFLHPNTGHDLEDHRDHPTWMGEMIPLNLEIFTKD